ncbi:hypothetical protein [Yinghuangia aomiensis]
MAEVEITIRIDEAVLAEAKSLMRTEGNEETLLEAVTVAIGAVYQRRAALQRMQQMAADGDLFTENVREKRPA